MRLRAWPAGTSRPAEGHCICLADPNRARLAPCSSQCVAACFLQLLTSIKCCCLCVPAVGVENEADSGEVEGGDEAPGSGGIVGRALQAVEEVMRDSYYSTSILVALFMLRECLARAEQGRTDAAPFSIAQLGEDVFSAAAGSLFAELVLKV